VLGLVPLLLAVSVITFILIQLAAGETASVLLRSGGITPSAEAVTLLGAELGLDKPLVMQYAGWLGKVIQGDLGESYRSKQPVLTELMLRFPATLKLSLGAMVILLAVSLPVGIFSAVYPDSSVNRVGKLFAFVSVSIPSFWLGLVLLYLFGVKLKWVPVISNGADKHVILPALTLALGYIGPHIRLLSMSMAEVLKKRYIKAARARGLSECRVIGKHALKNAILPLITRLGMTLGALLAGSFIVESIFSWPGMGKYALDAIANKDFPVIQGYVLLMAVMIVSINLLVDLIYAYIDPRIKLQ
jgi:peptide/nickel transport system permease protein